MANACARMSGKPGPEAMPVLVSGKWGVVNSEKWVFGNKKGREMIFYFSAQ